MNIWKYQDSILTEGDNFLYQVSISVHKKGLFETHNIKYYSSKKYIDNIIYQSFYKYPKFIIEKEVELIEAPLNWLSKNAKLLKNDSEVQNNK